MKLVSCALSLVALTACSYRGTPPANDVSYTMQQNHATTVTVHPPPPQVVARREAPVAVGTTTLTSATTDGAAANGGEADDVEAAAPDRHLGDQIRHALKTDRHMATCGVDRVRLSASDHRIRLRGTVPTLADKVAIEQRVREVKGVEAVDNDIVVLR